MLRPSDLIRLGKTHQYGSKGIARMSYDTQGDVWGTTPEGDFKRAGEAQNVTEAKRVYCNFFNRGGADNG